MPDHARLPLWDDKTTNQQIESLKRMVLDLYGYVFTEARERLLHTLSEHWAADEKEAADVRVIRKMIQQHPNIFSQNCEAGHITGSALIQESYNGRFLLHYHKSLNKWLQMGGHGDYETDPAQIALREAVEESGLTDLRFWPDPDQPVLIDVDVHTIPIRSGKPEHLHLDFRYLLITDSPDAVTAKNGESDQFMWADEETLARLESELDPQLIRFIKKIDMLYRQS
jgi:8-oxo-dGTP pyrophosphatase MutT (NUDIX family)